MDYFSKVLLREERKNCNYTKSVLEIRKSIGEERDGGFAMGGVVCAPLYLGFCLWVLEIAKKENIKMIMPLMREGAFYEKILKMIIEKKGYDIEVKTMWVSRKSSSLALCEKAFDWDFFQKICDLHPGTLESGLKRLKIYEAIHDLKPIMEPNEENKSKKDETLYQVYELIVKNKLNRDINERISETKKYIHDYFVQSGAKDSILTMDIGSLGTLPQAIDQSLGKGISTTHCFLMAGRPVLERINKGHDIRYFFADFDNDDEDVENFIGNLASHYLFETITMGNLREGTAIGYKVENGKVIPITGLSAYSQECIAMVDFIQAGIMEFVQRYLEKEQINDHSLLKNGVRSWCCLLNSVLPEEVNSISKLEFDDNISIPYEKFRLISADDFIPLVGDIDIKKPPPVMNGIDNGVRNKRIALYGMGSHFKNVFFALKKYDADIICIIDANAKLDSYKGIPVIKLDGLEGHHVTDVVISTSKYRDEVRELLVKYMEARNLDYVLHDIII